MKMKTPLRIIPFILGSILFFTQCEKDALNVGDDEFLNNKKSAAGDCIVVQDLWAGSGQNDLSKGTPAGTVTAEITGPGTLLVKFATDNPWLLTEAHVWVGKDFKSVPKNAAPGLFPYGLDLAFTTEAEFEIFLGDHGINPGQKFYVSAHGVVGQPGSVSELEQVLPDNLTFSVVNPNSSLESYFKTTVTGGTSLDGSYSGWCIDPINEIYQNTDYDATVYSSYGIIPEGLVEKSENLDLVNWVINQNFAGMPSKNCEGSYTYGDLQLAIWKLLVSGDYSNSRGLGEYSVCRADEIVASAMAKGENFVPSCGQKTAVILFVPNIQLTIIEVPVPCGGDETAWAFGEHTFIGKKIAKKWGWIFEMNCNY